MPHIQVSDDVPGIRALLAFRPEVAGPLAALCDVLLHATGTLSRGDRELIAAYVSHLNACTFCCHSHAAIAACHLGDEAIVDAAISDPDGAPIAPKLRALLSLAAHVQQGGTHVRAEDVARARAAGATDIEIHDTVLIAAAFCMFNRYVDGLGATTPPDRAGYYPRAQLTVAHGYAFTPPPSHHG